MTDFEVAEPWRPTEFEAELLAKMERIAQGAEHNNELMRLYLEHQDYRFKEWLERKRLNKLEG